MASESADTTNIQANLDLLEAAQLGDKDKAIAALAQPGVDVNCRITGDLGDLGGTPLFLACQSNSKSIVRMLLDNPQVLVNAADNLGRTALHMATEDCLDEMLLSTRTDINWNAADDIGQTPLLWFARLGQEERLRRLIGVESVDIFATTIDGFTVLHQVAELGSAYFPNPSRCNVLDLLLEEVGRRGHNVISFVDATDILNRSALHHIANRGRTNLLRWLLRKFSADINVNGADFYGFTPLHLAVRDGSCKEMVELLLQQVESIDANVGATVNVSSPKELKPFETDRHDTLCRPMLFEEIHSRDYESIRGITPLHYAVRSCNWEAVDLLLEKIEPCNLILQQKRMQILMEAVKYLKSKGILVFDVDIDNFSRLMYFVKNSHVEVVTLLLEEGKKFTARVPYYSRMNWLVQLLDQATAEAIQMRLLHAFGQTIQSNDSEMCVNGLTDCSDIILTSAARTNHRRMIRCILRLQPKGFNVNARSEWVGDRGLVATPLHFAVFKGHVEAAKEPLRHPQVNINAENTKKVTPLMCAIKEGNLKMVRLLFFNGYGHLEGNENSDGQNPLQVVVEAKMKGLENKLMERPLVKDFVDRLYRDRQVLVDAANALLVGAALIASVTFAGWLQPPLGYATYYDFSQPSPAPPGTYESYAAVKQHPSVKSFWVFNSLSFFFAIATVLAGAEAAMPSLQHAFIGRDVQSAKRALIITSILLVMSVVCVLGAFASAGFAVLPPLMKYDTSMIITVCVGGTVCMLTLAKFLWKLAMPMRMRLLTIFRGEDLNPRLPAAMDVRTWHMSPPDSRSPSDSGAMAI